MNCTENIMEGCNYNMSNIINAEIIDNPGLFFANFNGLLGNYFVIGTLIVVGVVMFILMKDNPSLKDTGAAMYAGLISSFSGLLLFLIDVGSNVKIFYWKQELILLSLTGLAIIAHYISRDY